MWAPVFLERLDRIEFFGCAQSGITSRGRDTPVTEWLEFYSIYGSRAMRSRVQAFYSYCSRPVAYHHICVSPVASEVILRKGIVFHSRDQLYLLRFLRGMGLGRFLRFKIFEMAGVKVYTLGMMNKKFTHKPRRLVSNIPHDFFVDYKKYSHMMDVVVMPSWMLYKSRDVTAQQVLLHFQTEWSNRHTIIDYQPCTLKKSEGVRIFPEMKKYYLALKKVNDMMCREDVVGREHESYDPVGDPVGYYEYMGWDSDGDYEFVGVGDYEEFDNEESAREAAAEKYVMGLELSDIDKHALRSTRFDIWYNDDKEYDSPYGLEDERDFYQI
jgi:hypothetical protein